MLILSRVSGMLIWHLIGPGVLTCSSLHPGMMRDGMIWGIFHRFNLIPIWDRMGSVIPLRGWAVTIIILRITKLRTVLRTICVIIIMWNRMKAVFSIEIWPWAIVNRLKPVVSGFVSAGLRITPFVTGIVFTLIIVTVGRISYLALIAILSHVWVILFSKKSSKLIKS